VTILVAKPMNGSMEALASGTLSLVDGCLALVNSGAPPSFLIWPPGYALVERDGVTSVTNQAGDPVTDVGSYLQLGGGNVYLASAQGIVDGEIPKACQVSGERYFIVGQDPSASGLGGQISGVPGFVWMSGAGWMFMMRESWSVQEIDGFDGRTTTQGVVVSSVPLAKPSDQEILPDLSALPPGEVALGILHTEGGASQVPGAGSPLPLSYEDFAVTDACCGWEQVQFFSMGGRDFTLWLAGNEPGLAQHEDDLRAIVASIRPRPV
jgi:hypothetical protein